RNGPPSAGAPAALCLDEPTRGMDRAAKGELASSLRAAAAAGSAVLVATHDPEFAATVADRVVLLADGRLIADGAAAEVLSGGWYFATETARIVDGALLPEDGADLLRARLTIEARP
ncbi:MAG: ABC transporter, partial [Solirubrobacteraceae bacterium]|nr:ABC transporter [Solirubrobacteraceae bacterium]